MSESGKFTPKESSFNYNAISIYKELCEKYHTWLKPTIVDVRIVQTQERVWLEITVEKMITWDLVDQAISRSDLAFCGRLGDDLGFFPPSNPVNENATKFVDTWDPYSIVHTTDLFHSDACTFIDGNPKYNPNIRDI